VRESRPSVDHSGHSYLLDVLHTICNEYSIPILDVPTYSLLPQPQKDRYSKDFSHESLYIRSLPDKFVMAKQPFFVDAKSIDRKDTGNISVELSAYYFDLKRIKHGIRVCFLYEERGEPRIFTPMHVLPAFIIVQPWWIGKERELFISYAAFIAEHLGVELDYELPVYDIKTKGSGDPCIIIPMKNLWEYSTSLENFILQMNQPPEISGRWRLKRRTRDA
jgi:hypothetical protein